MNEEEQPFNKKCPTPSRQMCRCGTESVKHCSAGYFGKSCNQPCMNNSYGVRCKNSCNCTQPEECHHIDGCRTQPTYSLELTDYITKSRSDNFSSTEETSRDEIRIQGSSTIPTHPATNPNKWVLFYIIIMAVLLALTFMLCLLRTRLSRCMTTVHKTHDQGVQLRVSNHSIRTRPDIHVQSPVEFQEDIYSEIRESQMIRRVFSLSQINTLMNRSIVVSTRNKSRSSDIYNHLDHSISTGNVDTCFESEYAHAHSVGVIRGIRTVVNPISVLEDSQSTDAQNQETECYC